MKTNFYKPLLASLIFIAAPLVHAQISLSVDIDLAPPDLPVYAQPAIPAEGYLWTPGYWSWDANGHDYDWVPGTWVSAPYVGALWTPGYWGYVGSSYTWNRGYWGDHIGYYGGINYGFGYAGVGYQGGYWNNGAFAYNRSVNNVSNVHITNVYSSRVTVVQNTHVSFNGGKGGVQMTATKNEQIINSMPHNQATTQQTQHENLAHTLPDQRLSANHGIPKVAATPEPGSYSSEKVEHAANAPASHASRPVTAQRVPAVQHEPDQNRAPKQVGHATPTHSTAAQREPAQIQAPKQVSRAAPPHEEHKEK